MRLSSDISATRVKLFGAFVAICNSIIVNNSCQKLVILACFRPFVYEISKKSLVRRPAL